MEQPKKSIEEQLKEAAYTLVGLGTVAYKASEPYRRQAEKTLDELAAKGRAATEKWNSSKTAPASDAERPPASDQD